MNGESGRRPRIGLVLTGGGARAAYQIGVLRAISDLLPKAVSAPFAIISGTSAGAINAAVLAANAGNFRGAVHQLMTVWRNFHCDSIYRADPLGAYGNSLRWMLSAITGGRGLGGAVSLLDNAPLERLLRHRLDFSGIGPSIAAGDLHAVSITCSGYTSGQSVTFYQGVPEIEPWKRARRIGFPMPIAVDHLLASSALPFIFPPVRINREYFGDGSMRQLAPVSPALHLGADRLLIIGVGRQLREGAERVKTVANPSLAQIAGHCLNSIFLDSLEVDLERLQRINRTVRLLSAEARASRTTELREVDFRLLAPTQPLEDIAQQHAEALPRTIRLLLASVGGLRKSGSILLSYLLFERPFCRALIRLGYADTMAQRDDLVRFLGFER
jgi:NTE family protein